MSNIEYLNAVSLWKKEIRFTDVQCEKKIRWGDLQGMEKYDALTLLSPPSIAQKFLMEKDPAARLLPPAPQTREHKFSSFIKKIFRSLLIINQ